MNQLLLHSVRYLLAIGVVSAATIAAIDVPVLSRSASLSPIGVASASAAEPKLPLKRATNLDRLPSAAQLGADEQLWGQSSDRQALLSAIDASLRYLQTPKSAQDYRKYLNGSGQSEQLRQRVQRSLTRFRQLVLASTSAAGLQKAVQQEFAFYQSTGKDQRGTVAFTGYFEPVYRASRVPTKEYRYPLFRLPPKLGQWGSPHPTRLQLEGADGLQYAKGALKGLELVWLCDRLEAFLVQVQGSARLQLTDGSTMTVGYAGKTNYSYSSVGRELVNAGKFKLEELTLPKLIQYFQAYPAEMNVYLPRNRSFVFFRQTNGAPATGSLAVPVTAERSIATDKSIFPPGALALIQTEIPFPTATKQLSPQLVSRYVLDQDTGGAIKGAGRVDIFMGTGQLAGDRAGLINSTGQLYYLLLKQ